MGPALLVVVALVAAGVVATTHRGPGSGAGGTSTTAGAKSSASSNLADNPELPITYALAKKEGRLSDYHWPKGCDVATGRLAIPTVYAPPCVAVSSGGNAGATAPGV